MNALRILLALLTVLALSLGAGAQTPGSFTGLRAGNTNALTADSLNTAFGGKQDAGGPLRINLGNYAEPVAYTGGNPLHALLGGVLGSPTAPDDTLDNAAVFQAHKTGVDYHIGPRSNLNAGLTALATMSSGLAGSHVTALSAMAQDNGTGVTYNPAAPARYIEGGRLEAVVNTTGTTWGGAWGLVTTAGNSSWSHWDYLVGIEPTVQVNSYPSANPAVFDRTRFAANIILSCGYPGTGAGNCDAGMTTNSFGGAQHTRVVYAMAGSTDPAGAFLQSESSHGIGLDLRTATIAYAAIALGNNAPVRARTSGGTDATVLSLWPDNTLRIGYDTGISAVVLGNGTSSKPVTMTNPTQLATYTVATLPTCAAGIANSLVAVTDATAPTYRGSLTGGGSVHTPAFCDGSAWTAH